jgi:hypothetical protein
MCSTLQPYNPTVFASIGLTYHQSGRLDKAIDYYHQSMGLEADINLDTSALLDLAVREWCQFADHSLVTLS